MTAVLAALLLAVAPAALAAPGEASADVNARYQAAAADFHRLRGQGGTPEQWRAVAEQFEAIHAAVPGQRRGADGLYSAALACREAWRAGQDWRDLSRAVAQFRAFVAAYGDDRLADDALMHLAALQADGYHDQGAARDTYRELLDRYPQGDQQVTARRRLAALETALAASVQAPAARDEAAGDVATAPAQDPQDTASPAAAIAAAHPGDAAAQAAQRELAALAAGAVTPGAAEPAAGEGHVKRVQFWSALEWTRVILTTDPGIRFRVARLPADARQPARVYFDLEGAQPADALDAVTPVHDAVLQQIRIGRYDDDTTRVVLDLAALGSYEVKDFRLPSERKIVVDLHPTAEVLAELRKRNPAPRVASAPAKPPQPVPAAHRNLPEPNVHLPLGLRVQSIMIDPGHGGHDPGATGYGVEEKDLALAISRRLRDLLAQRHPELRVGLTRDRDVFIPLSERPQIAKRFGADLFVSVHLNANPIRRFHGVETYFLNLTRDRGAIQVAARENATSEQRVNDLNDILLDLLRDTTLVESGQLAKVVQASLVGTLRAEAGPTRDLGVKQAPFLVLMGAEMPGILVEAGFITNPKENRRLQDSDYLDQIAEGIYDGLRRYIEHQDVIAGQQAAQPLAAAERL